MSLNQTKDTKNMNYSAQQGSMIGTQQTMTKYSEDEYSNYIDSSDLVVEYYKKSNVTGLESQFLKIDNWLNREIKNPEDNVPLVIVANEGVGKKTLLVKWMEFHQAKDNPKQPDIILPHFATTGGNNSNYFFAIYQFLIKLRQILDVKQKVELLEEKLRSYFSYWLGVCHDQIERQIIDNKKNLHNKIILVIEGIDHFVDQDTLKEAAVAFWLPRFFPKNIRVICTAEKNSESLAYFQRIGITPLYISVDKTIVQEQINNHLQLELLIDEDLKQKHIKILEEYPDETKINLFVATYMAFFLPCNDSLLTKDDVSQETFDKLFSCVDYEKLKSITTNRELFEIIIETYKKAEIINHNNLIKLLQIFSLSQKGLTLEEVEEITSINDDEWRAFLICFKDFFIFYKDLWILNNDPFKKYVHEVFLKPDEEKSLHIFIAQSIEKITPNSIRKLEEQTFHLFKCQKEGFFQLKEIISNIENFLLLFNPNNKYDLCRYWQALQDQGFDPVIEYNKAIEGFEMHYHPNPEDVFRIIVQISRFLKEFSDFETYFTPEFRHPPIKGTVDELNDIGLLRELHNLNIYLNKEGDDLTDMESKIDIDTKCSTKIQEGIRKLKYGKKDEEIIAIEQSDLDKKSKMRRKLQIMREKKKEKAEAIKEQNEKKLEWQVKKNKPAGIVNKILSKVEQLNVDIPVNRQAFRDYYIQQIQKILNEEDNSGPGEGGEQGEDGEEKKATKLNSNQQEQQNAESLLQQKKRQNEQEILEQFQQMHKNDNEFTNKDKNKNNTGEGEEQSMAITHEQLKEMYNLKQHEATNYYYKRWLWIQYPWACLSLKCNYSQQMKQCFTSATAYMSVEAEKKFTKQALKIAIEAKLKKQSMYQKKSLNDQSSIIKANMSRISHNSSLPQITSHVHHNRSQTQNNQTQNLLGKSQTLSRIDPNESREMPSKLKNQNKSMTNKRGHDSVQFFITEEYTAINNINREIEKFQMSPAKNNKKVEKLIQKQTNDQETSKVLTKSKKFKEKSQLYDPMPSLNETRKLDSVLPRLKQSIYGHSNREIYLLEQQSFEMKGTLNSLICENKNMAKSYKHLKKVQDQQREGIDGRQVQLAQQRIIDINRKIEETQNGYYFSVKQIERFKIIQRISDENKKQNQEWIRYLNYLLNNVNKMIKWEDEGIKKTSKEIKELRRINDEYLKAFEEKMNNHDRLIQQIQQNLQYKKSVDGVFGRSDNVIERSAFQQIEKMKNDQQNQDLIRKQKERQDKNSSKQRDIHQQLEEQRVEYEKLKEVIDIQNQDYKQSPQFQEFMMAQEKQADLQSIYLQRDDDIYDLERTLEEKQHKLEFLQKAHDQKQRRQDTSEKKPEQPMIKKTKKVKKQKVAKPQKQQQQEKPQEKKEEEQKPADTQAQEPEKKEQELEEKQGETEEKKPEEQQAALAEDKKEEKPATTEDAGEKKDEEKKPEEKQQEEEPKKQEEPEKQQQQDKEPEQEQQQQEEEEEESEYEEVTDEEEEEEQDVEDPDMPENMDNLSIYYENKTNQNYKLEQTRLALVGIIQTSQKKLNIQQSNTVKETINFDLDELSGALQEKLDIIKQKLEEKDYNNFMGNEYDKNKMYKGLIEDISEYGYEKEESQNDFDDDTSVNI